MVDVNLKVPALEKLIDYLASGVGAIAGPILAPWKASREGKARLISAQTEAEKRLIEVESEAQSLPLIAKAQSEARKYLVLPNAGIHGMLEIDRENITQKIEFQERKRLVNVRSVATYAAEELAEKEVQDHNPDPDWTARFFDCVQDVSSEEMQMLWGRLLSGEVRSPGSTSLRTLETLRNMSKTDAEMFSDACNFVFFDGLTGFILRGELYQNNFDAIRYDKLLHLQDCGLLMIEQTVCDIESNSTFEYQDLLLKVSRNTNGNITLQVPVVTLTMAGTQLYQVVQPIFRMDFLRYFSKFTQSENCQLSGAQIVERLPGGKVKYHNFTPIEPESDQPDGTAL